MDAYDFDAPTDRTGTHSTRWEKYAGRDVIPLWVADTDFRAPPPVLSSRPSDLRRRSPSILRTPVAGPTRAQARGARACAQPGQRQW